MSDIKLFRVGQGSVSELAGTTDTIEKSVQSLFEKSLDALLGVRFLASEFTTTHGGRIDALGLDENGCPLILEYESASNEMSSIRASSISTGSWTTARISSGSCSTSWANLPPKRSIGRHRA